MEQKANIRGVIRQQAYLPDYPAGLSTRRLTISLAAVVFHVVIYILINLLDTSIQLPTSVIVPVCLFYFVLGKPEAKVPGTKRCFYHHTALAWAFACYSVGEAFLVCDKFFKLGMIFMTLGHLCLIYTYHYTSNTHIIIEISLILFIWGSCAIITIAKSSFADGCIWLCGVYYLFITLLAVWKSFIWMNGTYPRTAAFVGTIFFILSDCMFVYKLDEYLKPVLDMNPVVRTLVITFLRYSAYFGAAISIMDFTADLSNDDFNGNDNDHDEDIITDDVNHDFDDRDINMDVVNHDFDDSDIKLDVVNHDFDDSDIKLDDGNHDFDDSDIKMDDVNHAFDDKDIKMDDVNHDFDDSKDRIVAAEIHQVPFPS